MQQSASEKERGRSGQFPKRKYYFPTKKRKPLQAKFISITFENFQVCNCSFDIDFRKEPFSSVKRKYTQEPSFHIFKTLGLLTFVRRYACTITKHSQNTISSIFFVSKTFLYHFTRNRQACNFRSISFHLYKIQCSRNQRIMFTRLPFSSFG